ncbi:hypothetical protein [Nocardia cyriacigeorgica]|jgi:Mce-associated membrane protein|uniref:hypothetical protein n=1 Tax=Nocardia cyriacigeorgica TaxID=135487 RepID=UPI0002D61D7A|nr:hypothetical protein [Nocardia cyriacigeorgica]
MAERRPVNKISSRRPVERTSRSVRRTGTPSTGTRGIVAAGARAGARRTDNRGPAAMTGANATRAPRAKVTRAARMSRPVSSGRDRRRFLPRRRPKAERARSWTLPLACGVAALALAAFAVIAALRPGVPDDNAAFVDNAATEEVRAAAEHALRTVYGYQLKDIDGYQAAVSQVLTGKMRAELDSYAATTISAIKQAGTSTEAHVEPVGVTKLTGDRAEVLVNLVVSAEKDGIAQQSVAGPVVLQMRKVDGRWLAEDIVDR